jgi:flavodoxin
MKTIMCFVSSHHGNTLKVANAINDVVKGELVDLERANPSTVQLDGYDLIGLGSGVYRFNMSKKLFALVEKTDLKNRKVFLFASSASGQSFWFNQLKPSLSVNSCVPASSIGHFSNGSGVVCAKGNPTPRTWKMHARLQNP